MASEDASGQLANLHLDEATGEMIRSVSMAKCLSICLKLETYLEDSKSELKKRQKQRVNEEKKREKAVAAPPKAVKNVSAEEEESNLTPNVCQPLHG